MDSMAAELFGDPFFKEKANEFAGFLAILQLTCSFYYANLYHKLIIIGIKEFLRDDYLLSNFFYVHLCRKKLLQLNPIS